MTVEALLECEPELPNGEARFVRSVEVKSLVLRSEMDGYLTIEVPEFRPAIRGRLAWLLEEAVERALELRGACPPGIGAAADLESSLRDQLYRARLLGAPGLMLPLPSLEGIVSRIGALDADDSATLRWWITCTKQYPVRMYLNVSDCMLGIYLEPITLAHFVHGKGQPNTNASPPVVVEWVDSKTTPSEPALVAPEVSAETFDGDAETPLATPGCHHAETVDFRAPEADLGLLAAPTAIDDPQDSPFDFATSPSSDESVETAATDLAGTPNSDESVETAATDVVGTPNSDESVETAATDVAGTPNSDESVEPAATDVAGTPNSDESVETAATDVAGTPNSDESVETAATDLETATTDEVAPPEPIGESIGASAVELNRPLNPEAAHAWRHWMQKLDNARGPKPLNAIEQLFINAYVPLADAYHRGIAGAEAKSILEHWSSSFSRSYSEAFDAMRIRGRRPMMVLDIPEAAQRLARLHGARSVQFVLVDGMRFDLGLRVENLLVASLGQQATLTDRFLMWSALPTTTATQLELISRGAEGLKSSELHAETPVLVARGRQASTLRRVRAGSRELLKLDLVEARLAESGGKAATRLDELAVEISDALTSAFAKMAPRTLVAVFGDHGFCLDATAQGTGSLRQGGATPDEVLVPGYAWLVGQTH